MSGMKPGFITGANAKIKLFGKTLAFAADVSYNVTVQTIPIEAMGKYEVFSNEPVAYSVDGGFSVIRYTKHASATGAKIPGTAADGNAPAKITSGTAAEGAQSHLNPQTILESQTFDLEIYQKLATGTAGGASGTEQSVTKVQDCRLTRRGMSLNKRGVMVDNYAFVGILHQDTDHTDLVSNSGNKDLE